MKHRVILFKKDRSAISRAIAFVTECDVTHSAVMAGGQLFDASESRGSFGSDNLFQYKSRDVEIYDIGIDGRTFTAWRSRYDGKKYDYLGALQWLLFFLFGRFFTKYRINQRSKVYCFEATAAIITRHNAAKFKQNINGDDLRAALGRPIYSGKLNDYLKRGVNSGY